MKKEYILFFDSGIGGLSTLSETVSRFNYNYLYFADDKNCPYGNKTQEEITTYLIEIINSLLRTYSIKYIVIACNTATAAAIDNLRKTFKEIVFIGTEPALNYAKKLNFNKIFSLTTPLTASLERYKQLKSKTNCSIFTFSLSELVSNIENYYFNQNFINKLEILKNISFILTKSQNYQCIVLGCTHYIFLTNFIKQFSSIKLFNGNLGITKNLISKLATNNIKPLEKTNIKILLSSKKLTIIKKYKKILSQTLANYNNLC